jgi:hypothetical protein
MMLPPAAREQENQQQLVESFALECRCGLNGWGGEMK